MSMTDMTEKLKINLICCDLRKAVLKKGSHKNVVSQLKLRENELLT